MLDLIESPYARTTDATYSVYYHLKAHVASARYGGGYVRKPGFHSSVEDNLEDWPDNYSIREAINRREPRDVGRALDITLSDADMRTLTRRLVWAVETDDPRLEGLREFFGTLDGRTVYGRSRRGLDTDWYSSTADSSHLWHIHLSFFTPFADNWAALAGLVSILIGESLTDYLNGGTMERNIAEHGDSGTWVKFVQRYLQDFGATLERDGQWGDQTTAAAKWVFVHRFGGDPADYDGRSMTDWMLREFIRRDQDARTAAAIKAAVAKLPTAAPTQAQVDAAVATYLKANPIKLPTGVSVNLGNVTGTLFYGG